MIPWMSLGNTEQGLPLKGRDIFASAFGGIRSSCRQRDGKKLPSGSWLACEAQFELRAEENWKLFKSKIDEQDFVNPIGNSPWCCVPHICNFMWHQIATFQFYEWKILHLCRARAPVLSSAGNWSLFRCVEGGGGGGDWCCELPIVPPHAGQRLCDSFLIQATGTVECILLDTSVEW